ncbi:MAG: metallophosphoesterase [Thermoguttaceae bacterium]
MKLGILSDTHGEVALTRRAVELFQERGVEFVVHCGDIGTRDVIEALSPLECHFVFGNCDAARETLAEEVARNERHYLYGDFGEIDAMERRIFFLHGHQTERLERESLSGRWDVVCYGHTHQQSLILVGTTLVINPGALHRTPSPSVAVIDTETLDVTTLAVKSEREA